MKQFGSTIVAIMVLLVFFAIELAVAVLAIPVGLARMIWRTSGGLLAGYEDGWDKVLGRRR